MRVVRRYKSGPVMPASDKPEPLYAVFANVAQFTEILKSAQAAFWTVSACLAIGGLVSAALGLGSDSLLQ